MSLIPSKPTVVPPPTSDAKNAYELLQDVIAAITEEPRRFYMPSFAVPQKYFNSTVAENPPSCGTVACIAGWAAVLKRPALLETVTDLMSDQEDVKHVAGHLVLGDNYLHRTAIAQDWYGITHNIYAFDQLKFGSPEYVELAIKRIKDFMETHRETLLARVYEAA